MANTVDIQDKCCICGGFDHWEETCKEKCVICGGTHETDAHECYLCGKKGPDSHVGVKCPEGCPICGQRKIPGHECDSSIYRWKW